MINEIRKLFLQSLPNPTWIIISAGLFISCVPPNYNQLAASSLKANDYDLALTYAKIETSRNPSDALGWYWLGNAHYHKQQYSEAISALEKGVSLNPKQDQLKDLYFLLGQTYSYLNDNCSKAIHYLTRRLEYGLDSQTIGRRGMCKFSIQKYRQAIKDIEQALKINSTQNIVKSELSLLYEILGFSFLAIGESQKAFNYVKKAQESNSLYPYKNRVALIHYALGDIEKAKNILSQMPFIGVNLKNYEKGSIKASEVVSIVKGTVAENAGILRGDIITSLNGTSYHNHADLITQIRQSTPGSPVELKILRGGSEKTIPMTLGSHPFDETKLKSNSLIAHYLKRKREYQPAEEAENSGDYRVAFKIYMEIANSGILDFELNKRIIHAVRNMETPPPILEEVRRHSVFAATASKEADDE